MRWVIAAIVLLGWGCAFDFDGYDPRLALTGGASSAGSSSGGGGSGGAGAGGDPSTTSAGGVAEGGEAPMVLEIVAVVADCIDPADPDPDACAANQPPATMGVDGDTTMGMMNPRHSYLRFDLDALAGAQVASAVLEITVAQVTSAESSSSGEIWQVEPFSRSDLFLSTPAPIGNAAIAGDQGAVIQGETVTFVVPPSLVSEPSLFVGVLPLIADGVDYDNLDGAVPPRLRVTVE